MQVANTRCITWNSPGTASNMSNAGNIGNMGNAGT